jgi:hypothetical protein
MKYAVNQLFMAALYLLARGRFEMSHAFCITCGRCVNFSFLDSSPLFKSQET